MHKCSNKSPKMKKQGLNFLSCLMPKPVESENIHFFGCFRDLVPCVSLFFIRTSKLYDICGLFYHVIKSGSLNTCG